MSVIMEKVNIHLENKSISRYFFIFLWIMYAVVYMTKNCFGSALAMIVSDGVMTKSQTGLINGMFYVVYAPLQVVGGILADKYSPEKLLKFGLIGAALVNIIIFFNHNYYVMLIVWTLNAVIQTPIWPSIFKIVSSQLVRSDRTNMVFFISFSATFGLLLGYIVAAFIHAWQYNFLVSAIALLVCLLILQLFCSKLNLYMKPDKKIIPEKKASVSEISAIKLFVGSGLLLLLPGVLIRTMIEQGTRTLSPTMLMELYDNVSPFVGNMLNTLIILSGILGMSLLKLVLYPRFIKNEVKGMFIMLLLCLPFSIILRFVGTISVSVAMFALCGISIVIGSHNLLMAYYNMSFINYGKNATAAGITNAAGSFGIMLESYGFLYVAEKYSWNTVTASWTGMIIGIMILTAIAIPLYNKFKYNS